MTASLSLDLFCRVVDNFGDIGVCWRLARQLRGEFNLSIRLFVDDLALFARIEPALDPARDVQDVQGVQVFRWGDSLDAPTYGESGDVVIEAFACTLPPFVIAAMQRRSPPPVWIDLEYLAVESWAEGCHALPSPHPTAGLFKTLFFPGLPAKTGGLIREKDLLAKRDAFQASRDAQNAWRARFHLPLLDEGVLDVSLFCYPFAPSLRLFEILGACVRPLRLLIPCGVAPESVSAFAGRPLAAGEGFSKGNLTLCGIPFLPQAAYDRLLWTCHLNFVRGEDSLVRAVWAGRPFVWNIYPQEKYAHFVKLDAFMARFLENLPSPLRESLADFFTVWNQEAGLSVGHWQRVVDHLPLWARHTQEWSDGKSRFPSLAHNLVSFARERQKSQETKLAQR